MMRAPAILGSRLTQSQTAAAATILRLAGIVGLCVAAPAAVLLRVYALNGYITYYPDTYAQLRAADNLLAGEFPISYIYPPGIATALSPLLVFLPDSLGALQTAVLLAGVSLIAIAFVIARAWTDDRATPWIFAIAVAFGAPFVFFSRVLWFDGINTLLIAASLLLAPSMTRRPMAAQAAYGVLLFAAVTVRYTNVVLLPAVFIASLSGQTLSARSVLAHARSRVMVVATFTIAALYAAFVISSWDSLGRFSSPHAGSVIGADGYLERLGRYVAASLLGYGERLRLQDGMAAVAVASLAGAGAYRLWRTNRTALAAITALVLLWVPVHASYIVFDSRYVMPAFFFVLFLATLGLAGVPRWWSGLERSWQRVGAATGLAIGLAFLAGEHVAVDISYLLTWPAQVEQSREPAYAVIRDELRALEGASSVVISSQALAIDRANKESITYDLIPHSGRYGINDESVERLLAYVREQEAGGMTVYYHFTEYEEVASNFLIYELGYDAYFEGLAQEYAMREIASDDVRPQRLYRLEPMNGSPSHEHH